ncbi:MAG: fumarylacetoacetate hydrolase family protein [Ktedonobacteraceae bacterium]|nr:fumarylacetoacetate hydrolase family protein [Ktedonobacteraceae bacterium]
MNYQIGTALVNGGEKIILFSQHAYLDFSLLFNWPVLKRAVAMQDVEPPTSLMHMMEQWAYWREKLPRMVEYFFAHPEESASSIALNEEELRWLPPLLYPRKLICIGTNYTDHIAEMGGGGRRPAHPYSFLKPPTTTLVGSGTAITLPEHARLIDWEVELAVVIGQRVHNVRGNAAMQAVAGYSVLNDVSARDDLRDWLANPIMSPVGIDWVVSKALDGFAPMGPMITPAEFVADPQDLRLTLTVNGQIKQDSTTANMVFSVQEIIEHLSTVMTLEPGDVIATGTPAGVGFARKPQEFLQSGDSMVAEVEGLGRLETYVH